MRRFGARLKVPQRCREGRAAGFDLDETPGLAIPHDEKVDFTFELVAQVSQLEVADAEIGPAFHRLQQMTRDKCFGFGAKFIDTGPVAQKPFRLLP